MDPEFGFCHVQMFKWRFEVGSYTVWLEPCALSMALNRTLIFPKVSFSIYTICKLATLL